MNTTKTDLENNNYMDYNPDELMDKWKNENGWRRFFLSKKFNWIRIIIAIICGVAMFVIGMTNTHHYDDWKNASVSVSGSTTVTTAKSVTYIDNVDSILMVIGILFIMMLVNKIVLSYRESFYKEISFYKWAKKEGLDIKKYINEKTALAKSMEDGEAAKKATSNMIYFGHVLAFNECKTFRRLQTMFICISVAISCFGNCCSVAFVMSFVNELLSNISNIEVSDLWSMVVDNIWYLIVPIIASIVNFIFGIVTVQIIAHNKKIDWLEKELPESWGYYVVQSTEEQKAENQK